LPLFLYILIHVFLKNVNFTYTRGFFPWLKGLEDFEDWWLK